MRDVERRLRIGSWAPSDVVGVLVLMGMGAFATLDAWRDITSIAYREGQQSHVLLVPIIAAWLVWVRRERLRRCPRDGRMIGPIFVAAGWLFYSVGYLHQIQAFWHLGAILVLVGCFLSFSGYRYFVKFLPAFVVLAFIVPVPGEIRQQIANPLQTATVEATQRILEAVGVDALREGNALIVDGRRILITDTSSGMRMVNALFFVSFAFAYGVPIREPVRLFIVAMSPVTAIVCNIMRLVPTVWMLGFVSEDVGARIHAIIGWVMLPIAFLMLMAVFRTLRWALVPVYRYTLAYGK